MTTRSGAVATPLPAKRSETAIARRTITCGGRQVTFVVFADGLVAVVDDKNRMIAGWPTTAAMTPFSVQTSGEHKLCEELALMGL